MTAELQVFQQAPLDERWRYAKAIALAGNLVPKGLCDPNGAANPGKVLMVMEQATVLGYHPMVGVNNINIIEGKVSLPPALMQALVRRAGHRLRVELTGTVEGGDVTATATLVRSDDPDYTFTAVWTPHRAHRAGLCTYVQDKGVWSVRASSQSGKPKPWQAYTEAMLKARAISEVCMEGATDVMMGKVYVPEELGANVDEEGHLVDLPENSQPQVTSGPQVDVDPQPGPTTPPSGPEAVLEAPVAPEGQTDQDVVDQWREVTAGCSTRADITRVWADAVEAGAMDLNMGNGSTLRDLMTERVNIIKAESADDVTAPGGGDSDE